jgi:putative transposase
MPTNDDDRPVGRHTPALGVLPTFDGATILWCTVCTQDRGDWCASAEVMSLLHDIWENEATAWLVGDYLLMPDHVHFFCTPSANFFFEIERWTAFWKDRFAKRCHQPEWRWQRGIFHHRLRSEREYTEKSDYMLNNPVRKKLTPHPEEWPWPGRVNVIRW